jgi:hypothetical protein
MVKNKYALKGQEYFPIKGFRIYKERLDKFKPSKSPEKGTKEYSEGVKGMSRSLLYHIGLFSVIFIGSCTASFKGLEYLIKQILE